MKLQWICSFDRMRPLLGGLCWKRCYMCLWKVWCAVCDQWPLCLRVRNFWFSETSYLRELLFFLWKTCFKQLSLNLFLSGVQASMTVLYSFVAPCRCQSSHPTAWKILTICYTTLWKIWGKKCHLYFQNLVSYLTKCRSKPYVCRNELNLYVEVQSVKYKLKLERVAILNGQ